MKFWFAKYELQPVVPFNGTQAKPRHGALLQVEWPDGIGYADCHPWPEFGDEPIDSQLKLLKRAKLTPLTEQSIWLAKRDADLRSENKSAFEKFSPLKNHYLITDIEIIGETLLKHIQSQKFQTLKIKVGRQPEKEVEWLNALGARWPFQFRLDFNSQLDYLSFEGFIKKLTVETQRKIEFVEDPFPFSVDTWLESNNLLRLAIDKEEGNAALDSLTEVPFSVMMIKPATQDVDRMSTFCRRKNLKFAVTSNLDHPLGQAHAAWVAGELKRRLPTQILDCGVLSHVAFEPNPFSEQIKSDGPFFVGVEGTGVGFDDLLDRVDWKELKTL